MSRAARWQLKALRAPGPGLQVESYLLQQDLAAGAKKRFDNSAHPMVLRQYSLQPLSVYQGKARPKRL